MRIATTPRRILIDADDTVLRTKAEWLKRYNDCWDDTLTEDKITSWSIEEFVRPECGAQIYQFLNDPTLYDDVQAVPGALETIVYLRSRGCEIVYATATNINQYEPKLRCLERLGFLQMQYGTVAAEYAPIQKKSMLRGDVLVDDGVHNLVDFAPFGYTILLDRPWNRGEKRFTRAMDWAEVQAHLESFLDLHDFLEDKGTMIK